jgi:4-amino-4-deoxy-L-arabinose transferase-like glycosyltransferase
VLFWRFGATSFSDLDEAHYAQTTRKLIAGGNCLTPYYNDEPFFDKPNLFYLFQAVTGARLVYVATSEPAHEGSLARRSSR